MHLGLATELANAFGNPIRVLLFLCGMLAEFCSHSGRMDACSHEIVKLIAQDADEFGGQRLVQNANSLLTVQLVVFGDSAIFNLLARSL
jgi:hypothetical protein